MQPPAHLKFLCGRLPATTLGSRCFEFCCLPRPPDPSARTIPLAPRPAGSLPSHLVFHAVLQGRGSYSGWPAGRRRNTARCAVFWWRGRARTQLIELCSGGGGGPEHSSMCCVPVAGGPEVFFRPEALLHDTEYIACALTEPLLLGWNPRMVGEVAAALPKSYRGPTSNFTRLLGQTMRKCRDLRKAWNAPYGHDCWLRFPWFFIIRNLGDIVQTRMCK